MRVWLMQRFAFSLVVCGVFGTGAVECAGQGASAGDQSQKEVLQELREVRAALQATRDEVERSRIEIQQLRSMVQQLQGHVQRQEGQATTAPPQPPNEEDLALLGARIEEQQQTKVESSSRFKLKLSGLLLFNAFSTFGNVDQLDMPAVAVAKYDAASGSLAASLRNSTIGVTGFGPTIAGAKTSADLQMDFFGGLPNGYTAAASGVARLRLGRLRFDWKNTSIVGGLDTLFFSPNSPTTYMSIAEPGLAAAGNLWAWTPGIRVEHRVAAPHSVYTIEAGVLDPVGFAGYQPIVRSPSPGENSRHPAYAVRLSTISHQGERPVAFGVSGMYSPQHFADGSGTAAWTGALDFRVPIRSHLELSGELFNGRSLDGFGGLGTAFVAPPSESLYESTFAPMLARIRSTGGWGQFKWTLNARNEANVAAGYGGRYSKSLRAAGLATPYLLALPARNETIFVNYIFKPRSDLVFSMEYRRLQTFGAIGTAEIADRIGIAAGFLF